MSLRIPFSRAWMLGVISLTMRLFAGIVLDRPELHIAGWISPLIGLGLWMPVVCACGIFSRNCKDRAPVEVLSETAGAALTAVLKAVLAVVLLWDAAGISIIAIETMSYATMVEIRGIYFLLPLSAVMFGVLLTNGRGLGGMASLWARILPLLFLLVLVQRFSNYVFHWLRPVFGSGGQAIITGGIASAGLLSPVVALWLIAEPDKANSRSGWQTLLTMILFSVLCAAVLLALHSAMTPVQISGRESRIFRLDSILTNGRAVLGSQLPVLIIWFVSQLITLAFELFLSAALLQRLVPRLKGVFCALVVCMLACVIAWNGLAGQVQMKLLANWEYLLVSVPLLVVLTVYYIRGLKEGRACKECG